MNLDHLDELLQYVPEPMLDAYSKGKNPRAVPPWAAAAALSEKVASKEANGMAQGAAQGPQPSVMDQLRQKAAALNTQAQMQQSPGGLPGMLPQPRMQPQAEPDVQMAASGGLMDVPVRSEMFGMAGGGIVSFDGGGMPADKANYETPYDRLNREANESGTRFGDPKDIEGIGKALVAAGYPLAAISDMLALPINAVRRIVRNPLDKSAPPSLTPALDLRERALNLPKDVAPAADTGAKATPIPVDRPPSSMSAGESAKQAEYARLIKQGMPPEMAAKAAGMDTSRPAAPKPEGLPGMLAQRPAAAGPAATGAPGALDTYNKDPAVAFAREYLTRAPTLPDVTKDFGEYQKQTDAKLAQAGIKPGETPWELAQKDMAEIQGRRAKEDAERERLKGGRARDEFMEFVSGLSGSNYGDAMVRGSKASRELNRKFQSEDEAYNKMRDEQDTKLKEMNRLAMGAKFDLANGRIKEHDQKLAERDKIMMDYQKAQATLAGQLSTGASHAAASDQTAAAQRYTADSHARATGASSALAEKRLQQDSLKALESNIVSELNKLPTFGPGKEKRAALEAELSKVRKALGAVGGYTMGETPGAGSPGGAKPGWGKAQVVK
jgi:hypothetical protein